ncbi:MAG TPA: EAL domain-containing protein [Solirubrobacterales bacterium]|jgi:diguanylate cyclase (GGDEF)-like protein
MEAERADRIELLTGLLEVQRAIVAQRALHEVFELIVATAADVLGAEVVILRLRDPIDSNLASIVASRGAAHRLLAEDRRMQGQGAGYLARLHGTVVETEGDGPLDPREWAAEGLRRGLVAPVPDGAAVAGSLGVATHDPQRRFGEEDRRALAALAENVSLALNHARALDDLAHEAFHDSVTGLPNRSLFIDRVFHALARAQRSQVPIAVLIIDLDDFQKVNEGLGHRLGDALLTDVASRMTGCLRPSDTLARLGGDEFAALLEDVGPEDAERVAARLLGALEEPFDLGGRSVRVGASIGIATGASDPETLIRDADLAMYRAKEQGKRRYETFEPRMHEAAVERFELDAELDRAIEEGELALAFQPIIGMTSGEVIGLEALVRWRHPTRGMLSPDRFIPLSEASGRIRDLGLWVLREACQKAALWRAKYPGIPDLKVGVNLSGAQLRDPHVVRDVARVLEATDLEPSALTLEVTETVLMDDLDLAAAAHRLTELKQLGIEVAVDDFGVGHSSLRYLKGLPLDNLKIAQAYVDEIDRPDAHPRILKAILDLADAFELRPVAEGIERAEQRDRLLELGCEFGQGYLLSKPLDPAATDEFLLRGGLFGTAATPAEQVTISPLRTAGQ